MTPLNQRELHMSTAPTDLEPEYLTVQQAAAFVSLSADYLNKLRSTGGGPVFVAIARRAIRYRRADLVAWMDSRRRAATFDDRNLAA